MDPITHALLGLGVASFSGEPLSLHSPVYLSAFLGSLAPDFDLVMQLKGDLAYLKHHRGASHSLPGSACIVGLVTVPLALAFPEVPFWTLFFWGWLGALSHCIIDIFNSYGSALLWPLRRRKVSVNLLNIFDPYLFVLLLLILYGQDTYPAARGWSILLAFCYIGLRYGVNLRIRRQLRRHYGDRAKRIIVMPALKGNWTWDVCVETKDNFIMGQMYSFSLMFNLREMLWKQQNNLIKAALESKLGRLFKEFTPLFHVSLQPTENGYLVRFFDLRYRLKQQFLHTGTAVFNQENKLVEEIFSPYLGKRNIKIAS